MVCGQQLIQVGQTHLDLLTMCSFQAGFSFSWLTPWVLFLRQGKEGLITSLCSD